MADHLRGAMAMFTAALADHTDGPVTLPFGTFPAPLAALIAELEIFVHACDLAVATGRRDAVPHAHCRSLQARAEAAGFEAFRQPGMFGPAVTPAEGADALEELLAYVGRSIDVA